MQYDYNQPQSSGYDYSQQSQDFAQSSYPYDQTYQGYNDYGSYADAPKLAPPLATSEELFPRVVQKLVEAGAVVHPALKIGAVAPLHVPGLVAEKSLAKGELLLLVPANLQLTLATAQAAGGRVFDAATSLSRKKVRIECPGLVAFTAWWMEVLEPLGLCSIDGNDNWKDASWLDCLIGMQLRADFPHMPHRRLLEDAKAREVMNPSPEVHNADWNEAAYVDAFNAIKDVVSSEELGKSFTLSRFAKCHLAILTRTFGKPVPKGKGKETCMIPVADMLNHSSSPNASWEFTSDGSFSVTANKQIGKGEEVLISYGRNKSNVRLFRTYGFTVHPKNEPCWSYRMWPSHASTLFLAFLPKRESRRVIDLETNRIDDTLRSACQACIEIDQDPQDFLQEVCQHFLDQYTSDPLLQPALLLLRKVRQDQPSSAAWWTLPEDTAMQPFLAVLGGIEADEEFARAALRVKMSEYLCLSSHMEALDLLSAGIARRSSLEHQCLESSLRLSSLLAKLFDDTRLSQEATREADLRKKTALNIGPDEWFELLVPENVQSMGWVPDGMAPEPMSTYMVQEHSWAEEMYVQEGDELMSLGWMDVPDLTDKTFQEAAGHHRPLHLLFYRPGESASKVPRPQRFGKQARIKIGALPQALLETMPASRSSNPSSQDYRSSLGESTENRSNRESGVSEEFDANDGSLGQDQEDLVAHDGTAGQDQEEYGSLDDPAHADVEFSTELQHRDVLNLQDVEQSAQHNVDTHDKLSDVADPSVQTEF